MVSALHLCPGSTLPPPNTTGLAGWGQEAQPDHEGQWQRSLRASLPSSPLTVRAAWAPCAPPAFPPLGGSAPPSLTPTPPTAPPLWSSFLSAPPAWPGYDAFEGRPAPLEDLPDARAVLPASLALSDQGGVGGEQDAL